MNSARTFQSADSVRRGLSRHRLLRVAGAVLWSSFMGAALATMTVLLLPESWYAPPMTMADCAMLFFAIWLLMLVPTSFAAILSMPPRVGA